MTAQQARLTQVKEQPVVLLMDDGTTRRVYVYKYQRFSGFLVTAAGLVDVLQVAAWSLDLMPEFA